MGMLCNSYTAELQWLGTMKIGFSQRHFKLGKVSFYIYKLNSRTKVLYMRLLRSDFLCCYFHFLSILKESRNAG